MFFGICKPHRFPCRWQANSMIVLDTLRIDPPYDRVICFATSGGDAGMETVIKVVSKNQVFQFITNTWHLFLLATPQRWTLRILQKWVYYYLKILPYIIAAWRRKEKTKAIKSGSTPLEYLYSLQLYPSLHHPFIHLWIRIHLINAKITRTTAVAVLYHTKSSSHRLIKKTQKSQTFMRYTFALDEDDSSVTLYLICWHAYTDSSLRPNFRTLRWERYCGLYLQMCSSFCVFSIL